MADVTATVDDVLGRSYETDPALGRLGTAVIAPSAFSLRRIRAERLDQTHSAFIRRLHTDGRVMASLGGARTDAESREYLDRNMAHWREHGFGTWILKDRITDEPIGRAGLQHLALEGMVEVELCYALLPEFWNRGLATDAARACVTIGRDWLGLHSVIALTLPTNAAAQRVLRKAALVRERDVRHAGLRHVLFRTD